MAQTLLALSLAPVAALIFFFYVRDRYEPEPRKVVLKVLLFGVLACIPAAIGEALFEKAFPWMHKPDNLILLFIGVFISVALVEELCKFLIVMAGVYRSREFDEVYDGIVYCVSASLGFAALENVLYVFSCGAGVGILRALLSVPGHALDGVLMGYFVGLGKFAKKGRVLLIFTGLFLATLAHAVYDFLLFSQVPLLMLSVIPFVGLLWLIAFMLVKKAQSLSVYRFNPQKEEGPVSEPGGAYVPGNEKCPGCGFSVPPAALFCLNCGHTVRIACQSCGKPLLPNARFCTACGAESKPSPSGE